MDKITNLINFIIFKGLTGTLAREKINDAGQGGSMKKFMYPFALLVLMVVQMGCESHHKDDLQEQQQESVQTQSPQAEIEHGGNSGNR